MVAKTIKWEDEGDDGSPSSRDWWNSDSRLGIGIVLLEARRPLTPGEIAAKLRGDQSNVRRIAEQMVAAGTLVRHTPPKREKGRGRQPGIAYALADSEVAPLEAYLADEGESRGFLREGVQLLLVSVEEDLERRFHAIVGEQGIEDPPSWVCAIAGSKNQYLMAFEGPGAFRKAEKLRGIFVNKEITCLRFSVSELFGGKEFVDYASEWLQTVNGTSARIEGQEALWPA